MKQTRRQMIGSTAVAGAALVVGSSFARARAAGRPIVIGGTISETGAYANSAKFQLRGYQYWVKQQNAKGGLLGRQLELKTYDDASDAANAVRLYQRLIDQDHVDLIVGPYSSEVTASVANVSQQHKMVMMGPGGSSPKIYSRGLTYIFQGIQQSPLYIKGPMEIAKEHGYKTIAVSGEDSLFPRSVVAGAAGYAKEMGMTIVFDQLYPHNASDYTSIAQKIKEANPDVVLSACYLPDSIGLLRALKQANFAPKILYEGVGPTEPNFGQQNGKDADGVMGTANWSAELKTAGNAEFVKGFTADFGTPPDYHAAAAFGGLEVLGAAITKVGSLDQDKLRDELSVMTMRTIMGTYKVDKNGSQVGYAAMVLQWKNGKQFVIYPKDEAQMTAMVPFPSWSTH
ncbi:MAG: amino acid ABC transporter substrate-binding protein [bacterium]|nr:amino acid ABC transporter substrate-binding protein [bacterium]